MSENSDHDVKHAAAVVTTKAHTGSLYAESADAAAAGQATLEQQASGSTADASAFLSTDALAVTVESIDEAPGVAAVAAAVRVVLAGLVAMLVLAGVRVLARIGVIALALVLWYIDGLSRRGLSTKF